MGQSSGRPTIRVSDSRLIRSQVTIVGDRNVIIGNENIIEGVGNHVTGRKNIVRVPPRYHFPSNIIVSGTESAIFGNESVVIGNNNTVHGNQCSVNGSDNKCFGDNCLISGIGNTSIGSRCLVRDRGAIQPIISEPIDSEANFAPPAPSAPPLFRDKFTHDAQSIGLSPTICKIVEQLNPKMFGTPEPKEVADEKTETESEQCPICMTNKRCVLFTPCNHMSSCGQCAAEIMQKNSQCHICRSKIMKTIRVFT